MNVLVLNNAAPFIRGGAEELAEQLVQSLNTTAGVEAELLRIPFRWEPADRILEEILINRNLHLYKVDRVIALKFPAYLIAHRTRRFGYCINFVKPMIFMKRDCHISAVIDPARISLSLSEMQTTSAFKSVGTIYTIRLSPRTG